MKVSLNDKTNITDICGSLNLSGSTSNVARVLKLKVVKEQGARINLADSISIVDDEFGEIFYGFIFNSETDSTTASLEITCYDPLIYFTKSKAKKSVFNNASVGEIVKSVAGETGIEVGAVPPIAKKYSLNARGKSLYEVMKQALELLSTDTGAKYYPIIKDRKLEILEIGKFASNVIKYTHESTPGNLLHRKYRESIENLVNRVYVTDSKGNVLSEVYDDKNLKFGLMSETFSKTEKNESSSAKNLFKGREVAIDVSIIGDWTYRTGYATMMQMGDKAYKFHILSDSHNYDNGLHTVDLSISMEV